MLRYTKFNFNETRFHPLSSSYEENGEKKICIKPMSVSYWIMRRVWDVEKEKKKPKLDKFHFIFINQIIYSIPVFQSANKFFFFYLSKVLSIIQTHTHTHTFLRTCTLLLHGKEDNLFSIKSMSHIFLLFYFLYFYSHL